MALDQVSSTGVVTPAQSRPGAYVNVPTPLQGAADELIRGRATPEQLATFQSQMGVSDEAIAEIQGRIAALPPLATPKATPTVATDGMASPEQAIALAKLKPKERAEAQALLAKAKKDSAEGVQPASPQGTPSVADLVASSGLSDVNPLDIGAGATDLATAGATAARVAGVRWKPVYKSPEALKGLPGELKLSEIKTGAITEASGNFVSDGKTALSALNTSGRQLISKGNVAATERSEKLIGYVAKKAPGAMTKAGETLSPFYKAVTNMFNGAKGVTKAAVPEVTAAVQLGAAPAAKVAVATHIPGGVYFMGGSTTANVGSLADLSQMTASSVMSNPGVVEGAQAFKAGAQQFGTAASTIGSSTWSGAQKLVTSAPSPSMVFDSATGLFKSTASSVSTAVTPVLQQAASSATTVVSSGSGVVSAVGDTAAAALENAGGLANVGKVTSSAAGAVATDGMKLAASSGCKFLGHIAPGLALVGVVTSGYAFMKACGETDPEASTMKKGLLALSVALNVGCAIAAEVPGVGTAAAAVPGILDVGVSMLAAAA